MKENEEVYPERTGAKHLKPTAYTLKNADARSKAALSEELEIGKKERIVQINSPAIIVNQP